MRLIQKILVKYRHLFSFYINYLWWVSMFQKGDASAIFVWSGNYMNLSFHYLWQLKVQSIILFLCSKIAFLSEFWDRKTNISLFGWKLFVQWGNFEQDISINVSKNSTIMICTFDNCEKKSLHYPKIGQYYTPCISFPCKGHCQDQFNLDIDNNTKGQLISECPFDFPKKHRKIWQISALESKKWWNQQNKGSFI